MELLAGSLYFAVVSFGAQERLQQLCRARPIDPQHFGLPRERGPRGVAWKLPLTRCPGIRDMSATLGSVSEFGTMEDELPPQLGIGGA